MTQISLLVPPAPPTREGIDLRLCGADELLDTMEPGTVHLWHADPPWGAYSQAQGQADPGAQYPVLDYDTIRAHIDRCADSATVGGRLVEWQTWPLLDEIGPRPRWRYVTGGSWIKTDHHGPGYHWSGVSELVRVYDQPGAGYRDVRVPLRNGWMSRPGQHSAKPIDWLAEMVRRWVPPGGLVAELYAGTGTCARAVLRAGEGRRYVGCEIDPERHALAMGAIAQERG